MQVPTFSVYKIVHTLTGAFYVGSTCKVVARKSRHFSELKHAKHHNLNLQALVDSAVPVVDQFEFVIVASGLDEAASNAMEELLIRSGSLNIQQGADGGDTLTHHPHAERTKARISEGLRKLHASSTPEERKAKCGRPGASNPMAGRSHTPEARKAVSAANKGVTRRSGFKLSDAHCAQISAAASLRVGDKNPFFGRSHSDETKAKLSATNKGKLPPNLKAVVVEGEKHDSVTAASRKLGVTPSLVIYRIKSPKYDYHYYD